MITDGQKIQIINEYVKLIIHELNKINPRDTSHQSLLDSFSAIDVVLTGIINANTEEDIVQYLTLLQQKLQQDGFKIN